MGDGETEIGIQPGWAIRLSGNRLRDNKEKVKGEQNEITNFADGFAHDISLRHSRPGDCGTAFDSAGSSAWSNTATVTTP
jgi:hypothetical protein